MCRPDPFLKRPNEVLLSIVIQFAQQETKRHLASQASLQRAFRREDPSKTVFSASIVQNKCSKATLAETLSPTFSPPNTAFPFDGTVSNFRLHAKSGGPPALSAPVAASAPPLSSFSTHGSFNVSIRLSLGLEGWVISSWRVRGQGHTNPRFVFHAALLAAF